MCPQCGMGLENIVLLSGSSGLDASCTPPGSFIAFPLMKLSFTGR